MPLVCCIHYAVLFDDFYCLPVSVSGCSVKVSLMLVVLTDLLLLLLLQC